MTTPSLKSALPAGSIRSQDVEEDFLGYIAGRPSVQRVILSVVQVSAVHASTQERGRSNKATYETVHAVEITDPHEADQLRHRLTQLRADRGFAARQPALFDSTEVEQRDTLLDLIKDWASEQDIPMDDVDARWVTYFGGPEHATSETVQACRSVTQLKEFAFVVGALAEDETEPAAPPVLFLAGDDEGDDEPESESEEQ